MAKTSELWTINIIWLCNATSERNAECVVHWPTQQILNELLGISMADWLNFMFAIIMYFVWNGRAVWHNMPFVHCSQCHVSVMCVWESDRVWTNCELVNIPSNASINSGTTTKNEAHTSHIANSTIGSVLASSICALFNANYMYLHSSFFNFPCKSLRIPSIKRQNDISFLFLHQK